MREHIKLCRHIITLLILLALLFSLVKADIISVNSGGSGNITITPDQYSGGFFSGPGIPGEGVIVPPGEVPGGPGGAGEETYLNIQVSPNQFNINMLVNTNVHQVISITNIGTTSGTVGITQTNLSNMIIVENISILLAPGETKIIGVIFVAPNATGIYNGVINVGNKKIQVSLNVLKEFILFDSNIVVLNRNYQVQQGEPLQTQVTLIPMGGAVRMDVTLNYAVKNTNGTIYLTRSETLMVDSQKSIRRDFDTGSLPLGKYVIELELIYPYGIAPSSAHFDVVENARNMFSLVMYWTILAIIMVSVMLIILTIARIRKKTRQKNYEPQVSEY
jgi:hypothetical protein